MKLISGEARSATVALLAQGINFLMILLPVALGRLDETAILVFGGAIAAIAAATFSWSFTSIYPGLTDARARTIAIVASLSGIVAISLALSIVGIALLVAGVPWGGVIVAAGALAVAQGGYFFAVTLIVQSGDLGRFAATRVGYALANLVFTTVATLWIAWSYALIVATILAFAAGAIVALRGRVHPGLREHGVRAADVLAYIRRNWAATVSTLFGVLAGQSSALSTPLLGPLAPIWASVIRIAGGFAGTSVQVVGPLYEMRLSRAIREAPGSSTRRLTLSSVGAGIILAVIAYVGIIAVLKIGEQLGAIAQGASDPVLLVVIIYVVGLLVPVVSQRFLVMIGHQRTQLVWIFGKLALTVLALVFLTGATLLFALALIELIAAVSYLALLLTVGSRTGTQTVVVTPMGDL